MTGDGLAKKKGIFEVFLTEKRGPLIIGSEGGGGAVILLFWGKV
jgi:hypothetical protein